MNSKRIIVAFLQKNIISLSIKERPENSAVYVYNKFGEVVYTSHITDMTDELPMPEGGLLLFLGGDGGTISL